ncbi:MAG: transporter small permease [Ramlibacter sp.]|jgi:TRAP-type C4-dicarboxylate transport system permease small subunit|nr:transporter small permease [Ramlibacter sp.]MCE3270600.1 transporter small permease [Ramlibacter sp.]
MTKPMAMPTAVEAPLFYRKLTRWVDAIDGVLITIAALMLFSLMLLVAADVGRRYIFNSPIQWSYEVVNNYLMPGLFFFAVSHTLKAHSHIAVDILHNYVGTRLRYWFEAIAMVLAVPAFALCTWVAAGNTLHEFRVSAEASSGLAVPSWTISIAFPIGFGMLTLRMALNAIGYVGTLVTGRQLKALPPISGTEEGAE